tara:strand:- start:1345 stop:1557 length:213 start_codon:yes stop_codon:yes gene_type:complete
MSKVEQDQVSSEQEVLGQAKPKTIKGRVITEEYVEALFKYLATQKFSDVDALIQELRSSQPVTLTPETQS